MKMTITARKVTMRPSFSEKAEQKFGKLDKFFSGDADGTLTITQCPRDLLQVEATVRYAGMIYRAETIGADAIDAVDELVDLLIRQIRKNKTRLEKRLRAGAFESDLVPEEEEEYRVVRTKKFSLRPMDADEAILQMNLLGHQFFAFQNAEDGRVNIVYRRRDGDYGLLEPYTE